jgi:hypothetical protein
LKKQCIIEGSAETASASRDEDCGVLKEDEESENSLIRL